MKNKQSASSPRRVKTKGIASKRSPFVFVWPRFFRPSSEFFLQIRANYKKLRATSCLCVPLLSRNSKFIQISLQLRQNLARESLYGLPDLGVAEEVELVEIVVQLVQLLSPVEPVRLRDLQFCWLKKKKKKEGHKKYATNQHMFLHFNILTLLYLNILTM